MAFRVRLPFDGPLTTTAVSASPSTSLSFARTPDAAFTVRVLSSLTLKLSPLATGASFTAATVIATVAVPLSAVPSFAL